MLHLTTLHSIPLRPIRLLRSALPTAVFMLVLNGVAESVMAQTLPNYVCYLRTPSGEVINLSSICGPGDEADTDGEFLVIRDVQVTDAGVTGVIVNESDQPVRIGGLGYELAQADGQVVLTGSATPATDVLLPNEPVQFSASFSGDDRAQLSEYANADLELAIAPDSVTPVEQNDTTTSGEVRNSTTTDTNTGGTSNDGGLNPETSSDGADSSNGSESGNNPDSINDSSDTSGKSNASDSTFDSDGNTDTNDTSDSTGNTETLNNGGDSDSDSNL